MTAVPDRTGLRFVQPGRMWRMLALRGAVAILFGIFIADGHGGYNIIENIVPLRAGRNLSDMQSYESDVKMG